MGTAGSKTHRRASVPRPIDKNTNALAHQQLSPVKNDAERGAEPLVRSSISQETGRKRGRTLFCCFPICGAAESGSEHITRILVDDTKSPHTKQAVDSSVLSRQRSEQSAATGQLNQSVGDDSTYDTRYRNSTVIGFFVNGQITSDEFHRTLYVDEAVIAAPTDIRFDPKTEQQLVSYLKRHPAKAYVYAWLHFSRKYHAADTAQWARDNGSNAPAAAQRLRLATFYAFFSRICASRYRGPWTYVGALLNSVQSGGSSFRHGRAGSYSSYSVARTSRDSLFAGGPLRSSSGRGFEMLAVSSDTGAMVSPAAPVPSMPPVSGVDPTADFTEFYSFLLCTKSMFVDGVIPSPNYTSSRVVLYESLNKYARSVIADFVIDRFLPLYPPLCPSCSSLVSLETVSYHIPGGKACQVSSGVVRTAAKTRIRRAIAYFDAHRWNNNLNSIPSSRYGFEPSHHSGSTPSHKGSTGSSPQARFIFDNPNHNASFRSKHDFTQPVPQQVASTPPASRTKRRHGTGNTPERSPKDRQYSFRKRSHSASSFRAAEEAHERMAGVPDAASGRRTADNSEDALSAHTPRVLSGQPSSLASIAPVGISVSVPRRAGVQGFTDDTTPRSGHSGRSGSHQSSIDARQELAPDSASTGPSLRGTKLHLGVSKAGSSGMGMSHPGSLPLPEDATVDQPHEGGLMGVRSQPLMGRAYDWAAEGEVAVTLVIVGDRRVGKTTLLKQFLQARKNKGSIPIDPDLLKQLIAEQRRQRKRQATARGEPARGRVMPDDGIRARVTGRSSVSSVGSAASAPVSPTAKLRATQSSTRRWASTERQVSPHPMNASQSNPSKFHRLLRRSSSRTATVVPLNPSTPGADQGSASGSEADQLVESLVANAQRSYQSPSDNARVQQVSSFRSQPHDTRYPDAAGTVADNDSIGHESLNEFDPDTLPQSASSSQPPRGPIGSGMTLDTSTDAHASLLAVDDDGSPSYIWHPTLQAGYGTMTDRVDGVVVRYHIWDAPSDHNLANTVVANLLADAHGAIILYSVSRKESFDNGAPFWKSTVDRFLGSRRQMLVQQQYSLNLRSDRLSSRLSHRSGMSPTVGGSGLEESGIHSQVSAATYVSASNVRIMSEGQGGRRGSAGHTDAESVNSVGDRTVASVLGARPGGLSSSAGSVDPAPVRSFIHGGMLSGSMVLLGSVKKGIRQVDSRLGCRWAQKHRMGFAEIHLKRSRSRVPGAGDGASINSGYSDGATTDDVVDGDTSGAAARTTTNRSRPPRASSALSAERRGASRSPAINQPLQFDSNDCLNEDPVLGRRPSYGSMPRQPAAPKSPQSPPDMLRIRSTQLMSREQQATRSPFESPLVGMRGGSSMSVGTDHGSLSSNLLGRMDAASSVGGSVFRAGPDTIADMNRTYSEVSMRSRDFEPSSAAPVNAESEADSAAAQGPDNTDQSRSHSATDASEDVLPVERVTLDQLQQDLNGDLVVVDSPKSMYSTPPPPSKQASAPATEAEAEAEAASASQESGDHGDELRALPHLPPIVARGTSEAIHETLSVGGELSPCRRRRHNTDESTTESDQGPEIARVISDRTVRGPAPSSTAESSASNGSGGADTTPAGPRAPAARRRTRLSPIPLPPDVLGETAEPSPGNSVTVAISGTAMNRKSLPQAPISWENRAVSASAHRSAGNESPVLDASESASASASAKPPVESMSGPQSRLLQKLQQSATKSPILEGRVADARISTTSCWSEGGLSVATANLTEPVSLFQVSPSDTTPRHVGRSRTGSALKTGVYVSPPSAHDGSMSARSPLADNNRAIAAEGYRPSALSVAALQAYNDSIKQKAVKDKASQPRSLAGERMAPKPAPLARESVSKDSNADAASDATPQRSPFQLSAHGSFSLGARAPHSDSQALQPEPTSHRNSASSASSSVVVPASQLNRNTAAFSPRAPARAAASRPEATPPRPDPGHTSGQVHRTPDSAPRRNAKFRPTLLYVDRLRTIFAMATLPHPTHYTDGPPTAWRSTPVRVPGHADMMVQRSYPNRSHSARRRTNARSQLSMMSQRSPSADRYHVPGTPGGIDRDMVLQALTPLLENGSGTQAQDLLLLLQRLTGNELPRPAATPTAEPDGERSTILQRHLSDLSTPQPAARATAQARARGASAGIAQTARHRARSNLQATLYPGTSSPRIRRMASSGSGGMGQTDDGSHLLTPAGMEGRHGRRLEHAAQQQSLSASPRAPGGPSSNAMHPTSTTHDDRAAVRTRSAVRMPTYSENAVRSGLPAPLQRSHSLQADHHHHLLSPAADLESPQRFLTPEVLADLVPTSRRANELQHLRRSDGIEPEARASSRRLLPGRTSAHRGSAVAPATAESLAAALASLVSMSRRSGTERSPLRLEHHPSSNGARTQRARHRGSAVGRVPAARRGVASEGQATLPGSMFSPQR